jgi:hypothetical protein
MSKLGRNDPCPCGSGKKYKQCCLAKDEAKEREARTKAAEEAAAAAPAEPAEKTDERRTPRPAPYSARGRANTHGFQRGVSTPRKVGS